MKQADVKIGGTYETRIGDYMVKVIVVDEIKDCYSGRTRFRVRKRTEDRVLPKSRAASALHELPAPKVSNTEALASDIPTLGDID